MIAYVDHFGALGSSCNATMVLSDIEMYNIGLKVVATIWKVVSAIYAVPRLATVNGDRNCAEIYASSVLWTGGWKVFFLWIGWCIRVCKVSLEYVSSVRHQIRIQTFYVVNKIVAGSVKVQFHLRRHSPVTATIGNIMGRAAF